MKILKKQVDSVTFIILNNEKGMEVTLCSMGASFYDIKLENYKQELESIVLRPSELKEFYTSDSYYGKSIGRFSGRIDEGKCKIGGKEYILTKNWNGKNALHGGIHGIAFQNFDYQIEEAKEYTKIIFTYTELEEELPGDVHYTITYQISNFKNEIKLIFDAVSTKDTLVNLTNHVYFNLSGNAKHTILNHKLQLFCDRYTKLNENLITEKIETVSPVMDFRTAHLIGEFIYDDSLQKHTANGYDHCWLKTDEAKECIAILEDDSSKRSLCISTSYPAIVCYADCYPENILFNENKTPIEKYHAICLECQFVPNGINMDHVEKAILKQGDTYHQYIKYQFDLKEGE